MENAINSSETLSCRILEGHGFHLESVSIFRGAL